MIETSETSKSAQRAYQAWPLLAWAAKNQQVLTYKDMKKLTGMAIPGIGNTSLEPIQQYCRKKGYPALTVIVVSEKNGMPGTGVNIAPAKVPTAAMKVFNFNWLEDAEPPTLEILEKIIKENKK